MAYSVILILLNLFLFSVGNFNFIHAKDAPIKIHSVTYGGLSGESPREALQNFVGSSNNCVISSYDSILIGRDGELLKINNYNMHKLTFRTITVKYSGLDGVEKEVSSVEDRPMTLSSGAPLPTVPPITIKAVNCEGVKGYGKRLQILLQNAVGMNDKCALWLTREFFELPAPKSQREAQGLQLKLQISYCGPDGVDKLLQFVLPGNAVLDGTSAVSAISSPSTTATTTPITVESATTMAPITVESAMYEGVDVTAKLQQFIGNAKNCKIFGFNGIFGDPKFGTVKTLVVKYHGLDGVSMTVSAREGSSIVLSRRGTVKYHTGMPEKPVIIVLKARYNGAEIFGDINYKEVTQKFVGLNDLVQFMPNDLANFAHWTDPAPGVVKVFEITYMGPDSVAKTVSADDRGYITLDGTSGTVTTAVTPSTIQVNWRLDDYGYIWFNSGTQLAPSWVSVPASDNDTVLFAQIVDTYMGPVYALSKTKKDSYGNYACYYRAGVTASNLKGTSWVFSNGNLAKIVLAGDYLWGVNTAGIYYLASYSAGWVRVEGPSGVSINPAVIDAIGRAVAVTDTNGNIWVRTGDGIGTSWLRTGATTPMTATPITIKSVTYGGVNSYNEKDFKAALQDFVGMSNSCKFGAFNEIFGDPANGVVKTVIITYCGRDGVDKTVSAQEGSFITLNSGYSSSTTPLITIISATYADLVSFSGLDYTKAVQNFVGLNDIAQFTVAQFTKFCNTGDPKPNQLKNLIVSYKGPDGIVKTVSDDDNGFILLNAYAPVPSISTTQPTIPSVTPPEIKTSQIIIKEVVFGGKTGLDDENDFVEKLQKAVGTKKKYKLPNKEHKSYRDLLGDPKDGVLKLLKIKYLRSDGKEETVISNENEEIVLYAEERRKKTKAPIDFILEKSDKALAVASGCDADGEPSAYIIGEDGKVYSYDSHSFSDKPWIMMTDKTATSDSDVINQFLLISASSIDHRLVAVRDNGKVFWFDFGDVISAAAATIPAATTVATPATTVATTVAATTSSSTVDSTSTSRARRASARAALASRAASRRRVATTTTATPVTTTTTTTPVTTTTAVTVSPSKGKWVQFPGDLTEIIDIAVGNNKCLVAIGGEDKSVYQHNGSTWEKLDVTHLAKGAKGVAVGKDGVIFALNEKGTLLKVKDGKWVEVISPVKFKKIYAGDENHVIAIADTDSSVWQLKDGKFEVIKSEEDSGKGKFIKRDVIKKEFIEKDEVKKYEVTKNEQIKDKSIKDRRDKQTFACRSAAINAYGMIFLRDLMNNVYHNEEVGAPAAIITTPVTTNVAATTTVATVAASTTTTASTVGRRTRVSRTAALRTRASTSAAGSESTSAATGTTSGSTSRSVRKSASATSGAAATRKSATRRAAASVAVK